MTEQQRIEGYQEYLAGHFGDPQWKTFTRKLRSKGFSDSVREDPRSDPKLRRYAKMLHLRQSSGQPGVAVKGDTGKTYKVRYHPQANRFSCTCPDWTYSRSVGRSSCKHIKRVKKSTRESLMMKTAVLAEYARMRYHMAKGDRMKDATTKRTIQNKAYRSHFKPYGVGDFLLKNAAAIRGRAARSFLVG